MFRNVFNYLRSNCLNAITIYLYLYRKSFSELYSVQSVIGVGGGGVVYAGHRNADNELVAVKLVPKEKVKRWEQIKHRRVPQEIALMMR